MAHQQTIDRLLNYLRRRFEVEPRQIRTVPFADRSKVKLAATFQAVEIDLREIVELVLLEEALANSRSWTEALLRGGGAAAIAPSPNRANGVAESVWRPTPQPPPTLPSAELIGPPSQGPRTVWRV